MRDGPDGETLCLRIFGYYPGYHPHWQVNRCRAAPSWDHWKNGDCEYADVGGLGTTYGGNPISCRAGLEVLNLLRGELLEKVVQLGERLRDRFLALQRERAIIGDVRGLGPMIGMELVKDGQSKEPAVDEAGELVRRCYEKGLIILRCGP